MDKQRHFSCSSGEHLMSYLKTAVELIALQKVDIKTRVSAVMDVSELTTVDIFYKIGQDGVVSTMAGPNGGWSRAMLTVEGSLDATGNNWWFPLTDIYANGYAATQKSLTAPLVAGVTSSIVDAAAAAAFAAVNSYIFINDGTDSEWVKVGKEVDNTRYDLYQPVIKSHAVGKKFYNGSSVGVLNINVEGLLRMRVTFDNFFFSFVAAAGSFKPYWVQVEAIKSEEL